MNDNEITQKIENVLSDYMERDETAKFTLIGFCICKLNINCDLSPKEIAKTISEHIISASGSVKREFLNLFERMNNSVYDELGLRVCDSCGNFMNEGYYLGGKYACSETCGVYIYMKDEGISDYNKALELLQQAAVYSYDNNLLANIYNVIGDCHKELGHKEEAIKNWKIAQQKGLNTQEKIKQLTD